MSSGDAAQKLRDLLTRLESTLSPAPAAPAEPPPGIDPGTHLLLYSFLVWESEPGAAAAALSRLYAEIIDPNELRVALPEEICAWCGVTDDHSRERAARMRACLNDIYRREHGVTLARLRGLSKREAREYLDALEGMPPFVAARVSLLAFGSHAAPLDHRLARLLGAEGAIDGAADLVEIERWLERHIRASESERAALLFEAWRARETKPPRAAIAATKSKKARQGAPRSAPTARNAKPAPTKRSKKDS